MKKRCTHCGKVKNVDDFYNDKNRPSGKHPWCKSCQKQAQAQWLAKPGNRERDRSWHQEWAKQPHVKKKRLDYQKTEAGKTVKWRAKIKARHGITQAEFDRRMSAQNNLCAACRGPFKNRRNTHIDHCHKTNRVRDILCHNCNRALGAVQDDENILQALIDYLRRHNATSISRITVCG